MHHLAQPTRAAATGSTAPAPVLAHSQHPPPPSSLPPNPPPPPLPPRQPPADAPTGRHAATNHRLPTHSPTPSSGRQPPPPAHPSSSMGQSQSHGPTAASTASPAGAGPGAKLRRALAGRRKKSEDAASILSAVQKFTHKGKDRETASLSSSMELGVLGPAHALAPAVRNISASSAKQLTLQIASSTKQVLTGHRKTTRAVSPPPAPPKPSALRAAAKPLLEPAAVADANARADPRLSIMPLSPGMNPALAYMRGSEEHQVEEAAAAERESKEKEERRKSDSTLATIVTARPGASAGNRASRPVSMAESVNSTKTVVPINKRLSALVTDFDFAPREESSSDEESLADAEPSASFARPGRASPTGSLKAHNRRSQSLNFGSSPWLTKLKVTNSEPPSASADGIPLRPISSRRTSSDLQSLAISVSHDQPAVSRTAVPGIIGGTRGVPAVAPDTPASPSRGNIRGRLAAWTAAASAGSHSRSPQQERDLPREGHTRQPTISMSGGLAPAAGFAMAIGKRGLEKVGRAWGARTGGSSVASLATNASTTTLGSTAPSSYPGGDALGRVQSNGSGSAWPAALAKGRTRRTPNAPSGSWSITSSGGSSSMSDSDGFSSGGAPGGVWLGRMLRAPLAPGGGRVFGRALADCVRETGAVRTPESEGAGHRRMPPDLDFEILGPRVLEYRLVPAIVLRCAQHILKWGLEEEGLFRINGRSTHTGKIRADFDTGADFNLAETMPSDLDPHAVSSVFKAYLRELPEPILTEELSSHFEAAMNTESASNEQPQNRSLRPGMRGPGLPSGPRAGPEMAVRKPPSLSTLAAPNFAGLRPPSKELLDALTTLISRMPRENRDLLRTVIDIMKATAAASKVTKMPLSNLLLVFCPSLHMSPPLLRVLCEAEGVWYTPTKEAVTAAPKPDESPVLDIKSTDRASVLDIRPIPVLAEEPVAESTVQEVANDALSANTSDSDFVSHEPASLHGSTDDSASLSASELSATSSQSTPLDTSPFPMGALSSAESLGPSTPSEEHPLSRPSVPTADLLKNMAPFPMHCPVIASPSEAPLITTRPAVTTGAVEFPTFHSPPPTPLSKRRSSPFLSLPGLRSSESSPVASSAPSPTSSAAPSPRALRLKRPSLTLLSFGKRGSPLPSASYSISSPMLPSPNSDSSSPALSIATAPPLSSPPPKISTTISSSPIFESTLNDTRNVPFNIPSASQNHLVVPPPRLEERSGSSSTSGSDASFRSALEAPVLESPRSSRPRLSSVKRAQVAGFDPLCVSFHDEQDEFVEDWTHSVLLAASCSTDYTSTTSVQEAIRAYEARSQGS